MGHNFPYHALVKKKKEKKNPHRKRNTVKKKEEINPGREMEIPCQLNGTAEGDKAHQLARRFVWKKLEKVA